MALFIRINPDDNVAVALHDTVRGEVCHVGTDTVTATDDIPAGHKMALQRLEAGAVVVKYGAPIGHLLHSVEKGGRVDHTVLQTNLQGVQPYRYEPVATPAPAADQETTVPAFDGFRRADGQVGIRNELWIIPTVGCVNGIAQKLRERFAAEVGHYPTIEQVKAFTHNYGCSQLGDDLKNTQTILADMVRHPNAAGVLIVALGCENNQPADLRKAIGPVDESRIRWMECQKVAGDEVEYGLKLLRDIAACTADDRRTKLPVSKLRIGLKCGGSDGLSGITANPLVGRFSDRLVGWGGTTVLTEVPEMFGAETLLMARCRNVDVFNKTVRLINDFKEYFMRNGQPVYENPSPGNKAGGISTLEEKSLGCTQKAGTTQVTDVLAYGERLTTTGLNLLSAPGNDLVAATALAAAGCQLVLFTTGRGTPFGTFVPTLKIATNSRLATSKPQWIDFDAGVLTDGDTPTDRIDTDFARLVWAVASGQLTANEKAGYSEMAIFKTGVTL